MDLTTSLKARDTEDRQLVKSHATIFVVPSTMLYNRVRSRFEFYVGNLYSHKYEIFCRKEYDAKFFHNSTLRAGLL